MFRENSSGIRQIKQWSKLNLIKMFLFFFNKRPLTCYRHKIKDILSSLFIVISASDSLCVGEQLDNHLVEHLTSIRINSISIYYNNIVHNIKDTIFTISSCGILRRKSYVQKQTNKKNNNLEPFRMNALFIQHLNIQHISMNMCERMNLNIN